MKIRTSLLFVVLAVVVVGAAYWFDESQDRHDAIIRAIDHIDTGAVSTLGGIFNRRAGFSANRLSPSVDDVTFRRWLGYSSTRTIVGPVSVGDAARWEMDNVLDGTSTSCSGTGACSQLNQPTGEYLWVGVPVDAGYDHATVTLRNNNNLILPLTRQLETVQAYYEDASFEVLRVWVTVAQYTSVTSSAEMTVGIAGGYNRYLVISKSQTVTAAEITADATTSNIWSVSEGTDTYLEIDQPDSAALDAAGGTAVDGYYYHVFLPTFEPVPRVMGFFGGHNLLRQFENVGDLTILGLDYQWFRSVEKAVVIDEPDQYWLVE